MTAQAHGPNRVSRGKSREMSEFELPPEELTPDERAALEAFDLGELEQPQTARRAGIVMGNPILLVLVLLGAAFVLYKSATRASFYFQEQSQCGVLAERPVIRQQNPSALPELKHGSFCQVVGTVQGLNAYATTKENDAGKQNRYKTPEQLEGVRYYVKLAGDSVFAVLPASRMDIYKYRIRNNGLFGFEMDEPGRVIDPDAEPRYAKIGAFLRLNFGVPKDKAIRVFDFTDQPSDHWPYVLVSSLMGLMVLVGLVGLVRKGWTSLGKS